MMARSWVVIGVLLIVVWACGSSSGEANANASTNPVSGQALYKTHCAICHGNDGKKGFAGAKLLPESTLGIDERIALISRGKGVMMPFEDVLNQEELKAVAEYTKTLK